MNKNERCFHHQKRFTELIVSDFNNYSICLILYSRGLNSNEELFRSLVIDMQKYLQLTSTSIIICFSYLIGGFIVLITNQINLADTNIYRLLIIITTFVFNLPWIRRSASLSRFFLGKVIPKALSLLYNTG